METHKDRSRPTREALAPGDLVDHYQVVRLLGRGGMGEVYLARDTKLGRKAALKVVRGDVLVDDERLEQFLVEARVTARFNHPHIVTVYGVGGADGFAYVALEYLEGDTLGQRLRAGTPGVRESLRIIRAIADALAEAHSHRILHWDLKPANVMLPRDGRLRVVDFGLAHALADFSTTRSSNPDLTASVPRADAELESSNLRGTPRYMAPERWLGREATEASDVWALGLMTQELLVGQHPYASLKLSALVSELCSTRPVPTRPPPAGIPDELSALFRRCVDKDPSIRPDPAALVEAIDRHLSWVNVPSSERLTPFRGLLPFTERHAAMFFGRDAEVDAFVERMRTDAVLPVVGPSGAGKSSFVQAGVLPRLREAGPWIVIETRPGRKPFAALSDALVHVEELDTPTTNPDLSKTLPVLDPRPIDEQLLDSPGRLSILLLELAERTGNHVLLFVDQLEELYTLVQDPWLRRRYMQAVCAAADDPSAPVRVAFTLRDDFLGRMAETDEARLALGHITVLRSPDVEALREILERPVRLVGYEYEDRALIDTMTNAVRGQPAGLPILQFACAQLWQRRDRDTKRLTRAAYEEMGGVEGALARHSDAILEALTPQQTNIARALFLRLASPQGTRRVVPRSALLEGLGPDGDKVLDLLTTERVIVVRKGRSAVQDDADIELVHESLMRNWERLARWLEESREEMAFVAEASQAAELWEKRGRPRNEVWQGDALRDAVRMASRAGTVPQLVQSFLDAGAAWQTRRQRRRRTMLGLAFGALIIIAVLFALKEREARREERVAEEQRQTAELQRAQAQREGAESAFARGKLLEARAKLRGSLETRDSAAARALWWRLDRNPLVWSFGTGAEVYDVAFTPDGRSVVAAGMGKTLQVIDLETGSSHQMRGGEAQVFSLALSRDGKWMASGAWSGRIRIRNVKTNTSRVINAHDAGVVALQFEPKGTILASGGLDNVIRLWDASSGEKRAELRGHTARVNGLAWSPDGATLLSASSDTTLRSWDPSSGAVRNVLRGHSSDVLDVVTTSDGKRIVSAGGDSTVRIWEAGSGKALRTLRGHAGAVSTVDVSPDSTLAASGSIDSTIRLWGLETGSSRGILRGHESGVDALRFSPDGRHLATAGRDGKVRLWLLDRVGAQPPEHGHSGAVSEAAFSPDGSIIASAGQDGTVRLWNADTGDESAVLRGHDNAVSTVAFHPDGKSLASAGEDLSIRIWDVATAGQRKTLYGHESSIRKVRFNASGDRIASASSDGTIRIWMVETGSQLRVLRGHARGVMDLAYSQDGKLLASASSDGTVRVWDADTGAAKETLETDVGQVWGVAWGADNRHVAWAGLSGAAVLGDVKKPSRKTLGKVDGRLYGIALDEAGTLAGVPCSDGTARLWQVGSGAEVVLRGHRAELDGIAFSHDGKWVVTSADDGTVRTWDSATGRPRWFSAALLTDPPSFLSHRGWVEVPSGKPTSPPPRWPTNSVVTSASLSLDGSWLCTRSQDGKVTLVNIESGEQSSTTTTDPSLEVLAVRAGCVLMSGGIARRLMKDGAIRDLASLVTTVRETKRGVLVARRGGVVEVDDAGKELDSVETDVGVTAVLSVPGYIVVGYDDGALEIVSRGAGPPETISLLDVPSSAVQRVIEGPMGTLIAGFENGVVGIWDQNNGQRLAGYKLHGAISHLALYEQHLVAASELGQLSVEDLGVFHQDACSVLRDVWQQVGVAWDDGRLVVRQPPEGHPCLQR